MASQPEMRGRDRKVFDNLGPVEVQFLSPRCRGDARSPRSRLILNTVKRERKALTRNPPAHPVEHRGGGGGTRTHVCIVVRWSKPRWGISLVHKGHGETRGLLLAGWTTLRVLQTASQ